MPLLAYSSGAICLHFDLSLHFYAQFVYASSEGPGQSAYICTVSPESSTLDNAYLKAGMTAGPTEIPCFTTFAKL